MDTIKTAMLIISRLIDVNFQKKLKFKKSLGKQTNKGAT